MSTSWLGNASEGGTKKAAPAWGFLEGRYMNHVYAKQSSGS